MLSRKTSDIIFYGIFVLIFLAVIFVRVALVNSVQGRIDSIDSNNEILELQINSIRTLVDENKNQQINNLYQMYEKIPAEYDKTDLVFYTLAKLEQVGISSDPKFSRGIPTVNESKTFSPTSDFIALKERFNVVEVQVTFTTLEIQQIIDFIDEIYNSEQLFIINYIEYEVPEAELSYIPVELSFLAIYEIEPTS